MSDLPVELQIHPSGAREGVERLLFQITRAGNGVQLRYELIADLSGLSLPQSVGGQRRDGLWQHTCFEAFFRVESAANYCEFNVAPNGDWAAYRFAAYRQGGQDLEIAPPQIETQQTDAGLAVSILLADLPEDLVGALRIGPSAVIETQASTKSYWALHHPSNKPDFHHSDNFKLSLD